MPVSVESYTNPGTVYQTDPQNESCTCDDWTALRSGFERGDPRRYCKHLLVLLFDETQALADTDPAKRQERAFRRIRDQRHGFPVCRFYEAMEILGWEYDVYFPLDRQNPWVDVYSDDGPFRYNVIENRWAGPKSPVEANALVDAISSIADEERGRTRTIRRLNKLRISVRMGIVSLLTFLVILSGGMVLGVSYLGGSQAVDVLMGSIMAGRAESIIDKTQDYLNPASMTATLLAEVAETTAGDSTFKTEMRHLLTSSLNSNPLFRWAGYGSARGDMILAQRMTDGSVSVQTVTRKFMDAYVEWRHQKPSWARQFSSKRMLSDEAPDPRDEFWYQKASARQSIVWSKVQIFDTDDSPGIVCSKPVTKGEELQGVVGVGIGLADLGLFLGKVRVGETGQAYILNTDQDIVSMPLSSKAQLKRLVRTKKDKDGKDVVTLRPAATAPYKPMAEAARIQRDERGAMAGNELFTVVQDEQRYIALFKAFPGGRGSLPWTIGLAAPEDDFMGTIKMYAEIVAYAAVVMVLVTIVIGVRMARIFARPLDSLAQEMLQIRDFHLDSKGMVNSPIVEVDNMGQSLANMKTGLKSFRKFVPADLVRDLIALGQEATLGGEYRTISIMFTDVAGFTSITEKAKPMELVIRLGEYMSLMTTAIRMQQGTVDKFIGDAIMAFWGAPLTLERHAFRSCRAAIACRNVLRVMAPEWDKTRVPAFHTRFGINTGDAIVGNMGSDERLNYTALGDCINLAARLESLNKQYGTEILISEYTYELVKDRMATRRLDMVAVKGKSRPVGIYELIDEADRIAPEDHEWIEEYHRALGLYLDRRWDDAAAAFGKVIELRGADSASEVFIERCAMYRTSPPGGDWTGVFVATSK